MAPRTGDDRRGRGHRRNARAGRVDARAAARPPPRRRRWSAPPGCHRPASARARRLTEAARDAHLAGRPPRARSARRGAGRSQTHSPARMSSIVRGRILALQGHAGRRLPAPDRRGTARSRHRRPASVARCSPRPRWTALPAPISARRLAAAQDACDLARAGGSGRAGVRDLGPRKRARAQREATEAAALLDRCLSRCCAGRSPERGRHPRQRRAQCYVWLEREDSAAELLDRLIDFGAHGQRTGDAAVPAGLQSRTQPATGRWALATAQAQEAVELAHEMRRGLAAMTRDCALLRLAAATGQEQRCRDLVARGLSLVDAYGIELGRPDLDSALGLLELGLGRTESAIRHLESGKTLPSSAHWPSQTSCTGRPISSRPASARATDARPAPVRDLRGSGAGNRRALGARHRRALSRAARRSERTSRLLRSIVEQLQARPAPFEVARTHLCQGERLRRAGCRTDARPPIRRAIEGFDQLGASRGRNERGSNCAPPARPRAAARRLRPRSADHARDTGRAHRRRRGEQPRGRRRPVPLTQDDRVPPRARSTQARRAHTHRARRARGHARVAPRGRGAS